MSTFTQQQSTLAMPQNNQQQLLMPQHKQQQQPAISNATTKQSTLAMPQNNQQLAVQQQKRFLFPPSSRIFKQSSRQGDLWAEGPPPIISRAAQQEASKLLSINPSIPPASQEQPPLREASQEQPCWLSCPP